MLQSTVPSFQARTEPLKSDKANYLTDRYLQLVHSGKPGTDRIAQLD